jgi:hypothetical protein
MRNAALPFAEFLVSLDCGNYEYSYALSITCSIGDYLPQSLCIKLYFAKFAPIPNNLWSFAATPNRESSAVVVDLLNRCSLYRFLWPRSKGGNFCYLGTKHF